jgi:hypothetical protein
MLAHCWRRTVQVGVPTRLVRTTVEKAISDRARLERLAAIRTELLPRIKPLCASMPDELFLELVDGMAEVQLRYELHENSHAPSDLDVET